jgi:hypothetical protein
MIPENSIFRTGSAAPIAMWRRAGIIISIVIKNIVRNAAGS